MSGDAMSTIELEVLGNKKAQVKKQESKKGLVWYLENLLHKTLIEPKEDVEEFPYLTYMMPYELNNQSISTLQLQCYLWSFVRLMNDIMCRKDEKELDVGMKAHKKSKLLNQYRDKKKKFKTFLDSNYGKHEDFDNLTLARMYYTLEKIHAKVMNESPNHSQSLGFFDLAFKDSSKQFTPEDYYSYAKTIPIQNIRSRNHPAFNRQPDRLNLKRFLLNIAIFKKHQRAMHDYIVLVSEFYNTPYYRGRLIQIVKPGLKEERFNHRNKRALSSTMYHYFPEEFGVLKRTFIQGKQKKQKVNYRKRASSI